MALATVLIYILLVLGIALVALGVFVVARQLLQRVSPAGPQGPYLSALVIVIGIASMGTSGFLALKKPVSQDPAQPQPSVTVTVTVAPAGSATPTVTTSPTESSSPTGAVTLSAPSAGKTVQGCDVFTGTSSLPADETVVVGVRNLSDPKHISYLEPVNNWDKPGDLAHWTGFQYFGSGDSSIGQTYVVSVLVVPSGTVKKALADPANKVAWGVTSLPGGTTVKQTLRLTRVPGAGPEVCR
jgi:hypothetical protein